MGYASKGIAFLLRRSSGYKVEHPVRASDPITQAFSDAPVAYEGVVWLPAEDVVLLSVQLPKMKASQRRASVAFAVEEFIAQPLEDVHVVLGPEISAGRWLVAVVSHQVMQGLTIDHKAATRVLPDTLALPIPETGWAVWAGESRILVRDADGIGFATDHAALPTFWSVSDQPAITLYGGRLSEDLPVSGYAILPDEPDKTLSGFSLRTGRYVAQGQRIPKGIIPLAGLVAVAVLGHLMLQVADVVALGQIAAERETALRNVLQASDNANVETALAQALASRAPTSDDGFLPLMTEVFGTIASAAGTVTLQDLRYEASDQTAQMNLEAPNLVTLQRLETDLVAAGLRVSVGAATTGDGAAQVQMTLQQRDM